MRYIIKVIVGSRAHGLADQHSDFDYRGVFVVPTSKFLQLGSKIKNTHWVEGDDDNTSWELGHFLHFATQCNPTILEVFNAPTMDYSFEGNELQSLFPYIWSRQRILDSHVGYAHNQRKKFLEDKDNRKSKYLVAYARTLFQAFCLFTEGKYPVDMTGYSIYGTLKRFRSGDYEFGEAMSICYELEKKVQEAARGVENPNLDLGKVNDFLLKIRKEYWEDESN